MTTQPYLLLPCARTSVWWKELYHIRPIHNVQPPNFIHKYLRPKSLTTVLSRCFEQNICAWITAIAVDQVDLQQYGSVKGTSTLHALVELLHRWKYAHNSNWTMIYLLLVDISKAFDRGQPHNCQTYHQMTNIIIVPTQIASEDQHNKLKVHYYQRRRVGGNNVRPPLFCASYKLPMNSLWSREIIRRRLGNTGSKITVCDDRRSGSRDCHQQAAHMRQDKTVTFCDFIVLFATWSSYTILLQHLLVMPANVWLSTIAPRSSQHRWRRNKMSIPNAFI